MTTDVQTAVIRHNRKEGRVNFTQIAADIHEKIHCGASKSDIVDILDKSYEALEQKIKEMEVENAKLREKWFEKGRSCERLKRNTSGCCCEFDEDGETLLHICGAHGFWRDRQLAKLREAAERVIWEREANNIPLSGSEEDLKRELEG